MVALNEKAGLRMISMGILLGMVACLNGMPVGHFSFEVQGDKVIVVYSGESNNIPAQGIYIFNEANIVCASQCVQIVQQSEATSLFNIIALIGNNVDFNAIKVIQSENFKSLPSTNRVEKHHWNSIKVGQYMQLLYSTAVSPIYICNKNVVNNEFIAAQPTRAGPGNC